MKLVLASKNEKKLRELREILSAQGVEVVLESDVGVDVDVEETGTTFEENAFLKARAVMDERASRRGRRLGPVCGRSERCAGRVLPPGTAARSWTTRGVTACSWRICGDSWTALPVRLGHLLLLPGRGPDRGPGGVRRDPGLRPQRNGRLRLRPHFLRAGAEEDLLPS